MRRSQASAISRPPPTQCPLIAAITSLGVCSKRQSVSLAWRQKLYLKYGALFWSISMSAPAQKNSVGFFASDDGGAPVSIRTWMDSSMRASRMWASSSRIIS